MLEITTTGSFQNTENFLNRVSKGDIFQSLNRYGEMGVAALAAATPVDSGATADSWAYEVTKSGRNYKITWYNTHVDATGTPIAILIQLGHGTRNGGYVPGRDYINPALRPILDQAIAEVWREVTS